MQSKKDKDNLKSPTIRDKFKEAINTNISKIYLFFIGLISILIVLTFLIGLINRPPVEIEESHLNSTQTLGNYAISVSNKYLSEDESIALFTISVNEKLTSNQNFPELVALTKFIGATNDDVHVTQFKGDNFYYEVIISDLPSSWKAIRLELSFKGVEGLVKFDYQRNPKEEPFLTLKNDLQLSKQTAELRSIQHMITTEKNNLDEVYPKQKEAIEKEINDYNDRISELEESKKYQTELEQVDTNDAIQSVEFQRTQSYFDKNILETKESESTKRIELMNKKFEDLCKTYGTSEENVELKK